MWPNIKIVERLSITSVNFNKISCSHHRKITSKVAVFYSSHGLSIVFPENIDQLDRCTIPTIKGDFSFVVNKWFFIRSILYIFIEDWIQAMGSNTNVQPQLKVCNSRFWNPIENYKQGSSPLLTCGQTPTKISIGFQLRTWVFFYF